MTNLLGWFARSWRYRQRAADLKILWPVCRTAAPSLDVAKAVFAMHVLRDRAWTDDYTKDELLAFVDSIT